MSTEEEKNSEDAEFTSYIQSNIKCIAESIKLSATLPVGAARTNFVTCFPRFRDEVKPYSDQIQSMLSELLLKEGIRVNIGNCDIEEKVDLVVDGVNKVLDRVRDNLNELNGIKRNPLLNESPKSAEKSSSGSWNRDANKSARWKTNVVDNFSKPVLRIPKVLDKPQDKFENKVDNSNMPFEPQLSSKPNSVKPLSVLLEMGTNGVARYCHPYVHELNSFKVPQNQLEKVEPATPPELNQTYAIYVDDEKTLIDMMNDLKNEKELAVDLEHHSYRSYQGLTCLMQISTRKADYIIDTLALRSKLFVLNEIFTDPNVVKVFHDANSDVIWLQKDLNLYIVNMFDTHLASLTLNFPKLSLSYLMKEYCNLDCDKRYQLFDWRVRPLPEPALKYARSDTHYLLYIYDKLRNALLEKAGEATQMLESVYSRGVTICKKRHEKLTGENDYLTLYKQSKQTFDNRQMHALKALYEWRDNVARKEDESTGFVIPNHMLLQVAEMLPREMQGILACCNPIPALVRKNLSHLHQLISISRNQPINKNVMQNDANSSTINKNPALSKLRCPHDFSHHDDFRDNLPTLLGGSDVIDVSDMDQNPAVSVFDNSKTGAKESESGYRRKVNPDVVKFVSPYERYKRTIVFLLRTQDKEKEMQKESTSPDMVYTSKESRQVKVKVEAESEPIVPNITESPYKVDEVQNSSEKVKTESADEISPARGKKRKQPVSTEQSPAKKPSVERSINSSIDDEPILVDDSNSVSPTNNEINNTEVSGPSKRCKKKQRPKKNKRQRKPEDDNTPEPENKKANFTSFDYSKTNFNRFATSGQKNVKQLLGAKIKFGANKREAKKKKFNKRNEGRLK